jgi:hypothetical protein
LIRSDKIEETTTEKKYARVDIKGYQISTNKEGHRVVYTVDDPNAEIVEKGLIFGLEGYAKATDLTVNSRANTVYTVAATENGVVKDSSFNKGTIQTYAITVKFIKNSTYYKTGIMTQAYAKLADGSYVYSEVQTKSIYSIADALYQNKMMNTAMEHNYLFDNILKKCNPDYGSISF